MPAGNPMRTAPSADPPRQAQSSKGTHIRNKDGTKLITVPTRKVSNSDSTNSSSSNNIAPPAPPPPPPVAQNSMSMDYSNSASSNNIGGRKKKKKKGKQQQVQNQLASGSGSHYTEYYEDNLAYNHSNGPASPQEEVHRYMEDIRASMAEYEDPPPDLVDPDEDEEYYSGLAYDNDDDNDSYAPSQTAPAPLPGKKKNKKKKKRGGNVQDSFRNAVATGGSNHRKGGKDRIWNTSTSEERERIKDFWLSLGEEERRSLVKVEKEAVLRKMKEQQKHSCSCSVCGRKRTAIEEELEVLYDAYYEELEQYANQQQNSKYAAQIPHSPSPGAYSTSRIPPPPPPPGPPPNHHHRHHHHHHLHHANHQDHRVEEIDDDEFDEEDDEEYDEEEEDVPDDNLPENDPTPDFFNFGNSLTVQGGILTVADDLLKNDGKKFIEMMEQLAERRMQREEEANAVAAGHTMNMSVGQGHIPHTHTQPQEYEDEEEYEEDEEDEEEYEEDEEDEPDTMTEEQRMEEGRRMFQIFAARMFEQRVLTAYREKVARERQDKLLEELDEEAQLRIQREEKKAKEKERKKEKKRLQKLAREEERLKKEAEKAAEEARLRAIEEKKAEESRKRKEEQRLKRDAEKKAVEEERRKKEEERKKRLEEEREREAERERKRKEHQERERRKREEAAKKAKEEKEARDKEAREKRERDERERKEKAKKREATDRENARKEEEERSKAEALAAATAAAKRPPPVSVPASIPQASQHPAGSFSSPHLSIATPALPKQPVGHSPARPRNASHQGSIQGSVASSPKTPQAVPRMGPSASPSTPILQHNIPGPIIPPNKTFQFPPHMPHMVPTSPLPHHIAPPPGVPPPEGFPISPIGVNNPMNPFLPGLQRGPPFPNGMPMYSPAQMPLSAASQYRGFAAPNGMTMQVPATPGMRPLPQQGRGIFIGEVAPGMAPQLPPGVPLIAPGSPFMSSRAEPVPIPGNHSHSRALSGSFDPIQRPTPIQRPSSVAPPKNLDENRNSVDELSKVMGSRALLEDDDEGHLTQNQSPNRRTSGVGFSPLPARAVPFFDSRVDGLNIPVPSWTNPAPLGTISNSLPNTWASGAGWSDTDAARSTFNRRRINRVDHIRALACKTCRELGGENNNFVEVSTLLRAMEQVSHPDMQILMKDLAEILDIEGDELNGGGILAVTHDTDGRTLVRFEGRELLGVDGTPLHQAPGAPSSSGFHGVPGEIGSPNAGSASPFKPVPPPGMMVSPNPSGF